MNVKQNQTFSKPIIIKFSDCDPAGIMFYGRIFYILHEVYESFLLENKSWDIVFENKELAYPLRFAEADYRKPMKHGETFTVTISIGSIANSSFTIDYDVTNIEGTQVHIKAKTVHTCIDAVRFTKHDLPEAFRLVLKEFSV